MAVRIFEDGLALAKELDAPVTIGGGEPTLHPEFWNLVDLAVRTMPKGYVGAVTNGYDEEAAMRLLQLHVDQLVEVDLSVDRFHEPISREVVRAYVQKGRIRTTKKEYLLDMGRAHENGIGEIRLRGEPRCSTGEFFLPPDGELWSCGCRLISFGQDSSRWLERALYHIHYEPYSCAAVARWKKESMDRFRMEAALMREKRYSEGVSDVQEKSAF